MPVLDSSQLRPVYESAYRDVTPDLGFFVSVLLV